MIKSRSASDLTIIEAYEAGYRFTEDGNILSPFGNTFSGWCNSTGYCTFKPAIGERGGRKSILVHRFIAYCVFGEAALKAQVIRHLNDIRTDNRPTNLAPGTFIDNRADIPRSRLSEAAKRGSHLLVDRSRKLTDVDIIEMRRIRAETGISFNKLAKQFGVATMTAHRAVTGASWSEV